ncbi:hypothetical protein M2163_008063 [Streptomyces sp. SAI-135]|nr:hypothetical protein [Streptomyces sp. SAI-090]MDH6620955.1 hypothetical protein [Streptomyces sp. SAI-135]
MEDESQSGGGALHPDLSVEGADEVEAAGKGPGQCVEVREITQPCDPAPQFAGFDGAAADDGHGGAADGRRDHVVGVPAADQPGPARRMCEDPASGAGEGAGHGGRLRAVGEDREVRVAGARPRTFVQFSHDVESRTVGQ